MPQIAVILPAYNEEKTIAATINDFSAVLPEAEIWIINNRSEDQTESFAKEELLRLNCKGGIINEPRKGKGNAVRRAFQKIDADIYILSDADTTYPAADVHKLLEPIILNEADMAVGDRHSEGHYAKENKRELHNFGNRLVRHLVNKLFQANLTDILSGYRVFNRYFVKNYPILAEGFEIETEMTLHALDKRFRIIEIPINYKDRPAGSSSKLNTFSDGLKVLQTISKILRYYRPLLFFGTIASLIFVIGLCTGIPVLRDWISHHYIYHVPLAILATGLEIIAFVFFTIGLILDSITHLEKNNFELRLLQFNEKFTLQKNTTKK